MQSNSPMMIQADNQYFIDSSHAQRRPSQHSSGYSSLENCMLTSDSQFLSYAFGNVIGKGNFSIVRKAEHLPTNMQVAIKIVEKTKLTAHDLGRISREVSILKCLRHQHITKMYQVLETATQLFIVMEYVPNGELFDYVSKRGKFSENDAREKFTQLLDAVEYCHKQGIVHRDLKMENILLDCNLNVKLADFGFGNYFQRDTLLATFCGSPPYAAPEIFQGVPYRGVCSDIWSLGVILYCMVVGGMPFEQECLPALRSQVLSGKFRVPYWVSLSCDNLIRSMLRVQPERRASISQIRAHQWMREMPAKIMSSHLDGNKESQLAQCLPPHKASLMTTPFPWNSQALEVMGRLGHPKHHIADLLHRQIYDHVMAHYLLLCDYFHSLRVTNSTPCMSSNHKEDCLEGDQDTLADQLMRIGITNEQQQFTENQSNHHKCVWLAREAHQSPVALTEVHFHSPCQPPTSTEVAASSCGSPIWLHRSTHTNVDLPQSSGSSPMPSVATTSSITSHSNPPNTYRGYHLPHSLTHTQQMFLGVHGQRYAPPMHQVYGKITQGDYLRGSPTTLNSTSNQRITMQPMSPVATKPSTRWSFQSPVLTAGAANNCFTPCPQRRRMSVACTDPCNSIGGPYSVICPPNISGDQTGRQLMQAPPILVNPVHNVNNTRINDRRASDIASSNGFGLLPMTSPPHGNNGEDTASRRGPGPALHRVEGVWELSHMTGSPYHYPQNFMHPLVNHSVTSSVIPENYVVDSRHPDSRNFEFDSQYSDF